jgi:hypothetical protein
LEYQLAEIRLGGTFLYRLANNQRTGGYMHESYNKVLVSLVGRQLTAVAFVMDYIRLEFEDAFLTALSLPYVRVGDKRLASGLPGYRDMLCELITQQVTNASDTEHEEIRIEFNDGSLIAIPLGADEYRGKEAAILQVPSQALCVWRPE